MSSVWNDIHRLWRNGDLTSKDFWGDFFRTWIRYGVTISNEVVPIAHCAVLEWKSKPLMARAEATRELSRNEAAYLWHDLDTLQQSHRAELERRQDIQRRAQGNLITITVATTFTVGVVTLTQRQMSDDNLATPPAWLVAMLIAAILSLAQSGYCALRVIQTGRLYDWWLQEQPTVEPCATEGETKVALCEKRKERLVKIVLLNQGHTMNKANYGSASYTCLRNGMLLVVLILSMAVVRGGKLW